MKAGNGRGGAWWRADWRGIPSPAACTEHGTDGVRIHTAAYGLEIMRYPAMGELVTHAGVSITLVNRVAHSEAMWGRKSTSTLLEEITIRFMQPPRVCWRGKPQVSV
jgi:hypothetical protein